MQVTVYKFCGVCFFVHSLYVLKNIDHVKIELHLLFIYLL